MAKLIAILTKEGYSCKFLNIVMGFYFCNNGVKTYDDLPDLEIMLKTENGSGMLKIPKEAYAIKDYIGVLGPDFMIGISPIDVGATKDSKDGHYWILGDQFMK